MLARQSPFERLLGANFARLPAPVRRIHALHQPLHTSGRADVAVATGLAARLICRIAGLPPHGHDIDVSVLFSPERIGREHWRRRFGARSYQSTIAAGEGRDQGHIVEHFGPFRLMFALTARDDGLVWSVARWRLWAFPLPRWSTPRIECFEGANGERFTFDIAAAFPLVGHVIRYRGWLVPDGAQG